MMACKENAKIVLLCLDLSRETNNLQETVKYWFEQLNNNCEIEEREVFFVGTKSDIKIDSVVDKINRIKKVMKTMVIHSNNDELIDIKYAMELSNYSDEFHVCEGTHSNIIIDNELVYNIIKFIDN